MLQALEGLYEEFGYYREALISKMFEGKDGQEQMTAILNNYRVNPPQAFANIAVARVEDYLTGVVTMRDGTTEVIQLPKENVLKFILEDGSWVTVRPSGTQLKCNFYHFSARKPPLQGVRRESSNE